MKLDVSKVSHGCRLGILSEFGQCGDQRIETPACAMYTRAGSVPYLTSDMVDRLSNVSGLVQVPLTLLAQHQESIANYKKGIKSFAAIKNSVVYSCVQDPVQAIVSGYNDKHGSSIWTKSGRIKLEVDSFMDLQEAIQPDMYEVLADSDTPRDASNKRLHKAFDRSLGFLDRCIDRHGKSERLGHSALLAVVGGGHNEEERKRSAKEVASRPVQGFVIGGLHNFGKKTEHFQISEVKNLLQKTMAFLPPDRCRLLHAILTPHNVLEACENGIDIMDSSYPYIATERGCALTFSYNLPNPSTEPAGDAENNAPKVVEGAGYEVDLKDKKYFDDFGALVPECTCYTCQTHSRAYIHHLQNTTELLGSILLNLHNLHHYFGFFDAIRTALRMDRYPQLRQLVLSQKPAQKTDTDTNSSKTSTEKKQGHKQL